MTRRQLTENKAKVLGLLPSCPGASSGQLAVLAELNPTQVTVILYELRSRGLVDFTCDNKHNYRKLWFLA